MCDEEHWVAAHEAWPGDPLFLPGVDDFGEPGLMSEAMELDASEVEEDEIPGIGPPFSPT